MVSELLFVLMLLWLGGQAWAQDAYLARWKTLRAGQPEGISFQISVAKSEFYQGEPIPLQLCFASSQIRGFIVQAGMQERAGYSNGFDEFLVDPAALSEDPLREFANEGVVISGAFGGPVLLSGKPFVFEEFLNEWVRFLKPGKFRIAIVTRRAAQAADPTRSEYYLHSHPEGKAVALVSNILTLNVVPAPAAWVTEQIADAVRVLDGPAGFSEDARQRRLRAGRTLRFLDSPEAAEELVRHLGSEEDSDSFALHKGVLESPYRKQLLPLMEARLVAPDQAVSNRFLDTLSRLSVLVTPSGSMDLARKKYHERLIASLAGKEPEPRAVSTIALLDSGFSLGDQALSAFLMADFHALFVRTQSNLLESHWSLIRGPAMLPVLREIYAHPPEPRLDPSLQDLAVRRIYDLAPEEGRRILVSEIAQPDTRLSPKTLDMLPDDRLPELNGPLAKLLEANQYPDALIVRYATGDIVQQVEAAYRKRNEEFEQRKLPHCGGPLIYYFLRYDPAFGERELRAEMEKPAPFPACDDMGFQFLSLGRYAYSPALERLAIEFLASPKVPVKRGAAEVLGKYGSPAAQKPLWDTLVYFRSWWKGREEQLGEQSGEEGRQLERALRIALAQADGWTLREDGLNRLLSLCSSDWCQQGVKEWLAQAASPVEIQILSGFDGFHAMIAQYLAHSEEQFRRKVLQFPGGTVFRVPPFATGGDWARAEQMVRSAGYPIVRQ